MATTLSCSQELLTEVGYSGYRKHSSGDLHSRLKTRKLLGVGETDDGDVHRSKLSQILGHSEQLYTRLPRGLRLCQYVTAAIFSLCALCALFFPGHVLQCILGEDAPVGSTLMCVRLYGVGLISFTLLFFGTLYSSDKDTIRWSLIASTAFFVLHTFVGVLSAPSAAVSVLWGAAVTVATIVPALPPAYFYWIITSRHHYGNKCAPVGDVSWRK